MEGVVGREYAGGGREGGSKASQIGRGARGQSCSMDAGGKGGAAGTERGPSNTAVEVQHAFRTAAMGFAFKLRFLPCP